VAALASMAQGETPPSQPAEVGVVSANPVTRFELNLSTAEPQDPAPIWSYRGEELIYSLEFFGTEMARGVLVVGDASSYEGQTVVPVSGMARTEGVAAMVYPMQDEGTTLIDVETGLAVTTEKHLDERGHYRRYDVDFHRQQYRGQVTRVRRNVTSNYERILPSNTHDAFSWIYVVRDQDLEPNTTRVYYMYDGWKLSRVTVTVQEGHEDILVGDDYVRCRQLALYREVMDTARPLPFIQETGMLPPAMRVREDRGGEQVGHLFISDDERRLPVMMEFQNALITAVARLISITPPHEGY
jgi:hypothetical protein